MTDTKKTTELNDAELDNVQGGIGLLLPAVQRARGKVVASKTSKEFLSSGHTSGNVVKGGDKDFSSSAGGNPTV